MPNPRRPLLPGAPTHVIVRGHNRSAVFGQPTECAFFLEFLQHAAHEARVAIHAFALMSTHAHVILTPPSVDGLAKMMQRVGARYARFFNRRCDRSGAVWEGRYRGYTIDTDRYFFTCLRYVEMNPVAAGLVQHPEEYAWSSYSAHAFGRWPRWLTPHPLYLALGDSPAERQRQYRVLCDEPLNDEEIAWFAYLADRVWPYTTLALQYGATHILPPVNSGPANSGCSE